MRRPIRTSLVAAVVLAPFAYGTSAAGTVVDVARLLDVFFALHFTLLLAIALFWNLEWRLAPPPRWAGAVHVAGNSGGDESVAW